MEQMHPAIAYIVNQYPKVSHSFIRREILALEAHGLQVMRITIRSGKAELVDEADQQELLRTRVILQAGLQGLLVALMQTVFRRPLRFMKTLWLTLKLGWPSDRGVVTHLAYLAEACILLKWLTEAGIKHVHAHFGTNSTTVALLCHELGGPPYSFTVHGPEEFDRVRGISLTEKINRAAFVVAISEFGRSQLYRWCQHDQWSKLHVVRCGLDQDFLLPSLTAPPPAPRLVCVGRLCEQKGQLLLLQAVKQVVEQGYPMKLVLVGDGPLRPEIEASIQHLQLEAYVEITGWANGLEVRQQILNSRALVLPSFAEGLPVVLMESLALGRPVISTYVAGIPELVEPGVNGWLVPPGSVEAMVEILCTVLQLPVERLSNLGKAGLSQVLQHHDIMVETTKLATLFRSAVAQMEDKVMPCSTSSIFNNRLVHTGSPQAND